MILDSENCVLRLQNFQKMANNKLYNKTFRGILVLYFGRKKGWLIMSGRIEEIVNNAKITELLNKKKADEENKNCVLWILAIIGAVAAVAAIAFAVYRYMNPKYVDFDYDDFEDDFDDDEEIDDNDVYVKPARK